LGLRTFNIKKRSKWDDFTISIEPSHELPSSMPPPPKIRVQATTSVNEQVKKPRGQEKENAHPHEPASKVQAADMLQAGAQNQRPRRANANLHPGLPDVKVTKPRRTSAQVLADKAATAAKKMEKEKNLAELRQASIKRVATMEDKMVVDEEKKMGEAARPPAGKVTKSLTKRLPPVVKKKKVVMADVNSLAEGDDPLMCQAGMLSEKVLDPDEQTQVLITPERLALRVYYSEEEEEEENDKAAGMASPVGNGTLSSLM
jgi:YesN/AraC family two-component response regulator